MAFPPGFSSTLSAWEPVILVLGFILALYQLKQYEQGQKTRLENRLNEEYREIWRDVDQDLILNPRYHEKDVGDNDDRNKQVEEHNLDKADAKAIYSYVDLTNQQIFLRKRGRISKERWKDWEAGIKTMIQHPPISQEWARIKEKTDTEFGRDFDELRQLESRGKDFDTDPYYWDVPPYWIPIRRFWEILPFI